MGWRKCEKLGEGSYGTVYFACCTSSFAAVKTSKLDQSSSLRKEAKFLKELRGNPYVVECFGEDISFEGEEGWVYNLLMEYAPEGTLDDLIGGCQGHMPEALVAYYSYMMLRGIFSIHQKGLVHCDIKPRNVLVFKNRNGSNHLKLADFGLSNYVYATPESVESGQHGKETDIWAFGRTVRTMMFGGRPIWSEIPQHVSKLGRDFLIRCNQMDTESTWSADKLLNHPFIKANTKGMVPPSGFEFSNFIQAENPFGSWINTSGLFTSNVEPEEQPKPWEDYQLFPEQERSYLLFGGS